MHIDHINISAHEKLLVEEKEFLCEVFGLTVGKRPNLSRNGYWLYSEDKALIHLIESNDHVRNEKQGYLDHVAFQLSGLDKLIKTLEKLTVEYSTIYSADRDMTQIFFKPPSGIRLEGMFLREKLNN